MFSFLKFWHKKNNTFQEDLQKNDSPDLALEVPEDWNFYMCQIDEVPASYFLNLALAKIAPITNRSTLLWVEIKMNCSRKDGLSSSEEFEHLAQIEDQIIPALTSELAILYVGRLTHNHLRDLYFYCEDGTDPEHIINEVMQFYPEYRYRFDQKLDSDWSTYFNYMYPSKEIMQTISNRSVIENLQNHGDNLEVARAIDHWIYFKNEVDLHKFVEIILSWDFQINQRNKIEEYDGFPYQLQISKTEFVDQQSIDHCTLQLSQLANQLNGEYDGWETVVIKK